MREQKNVSQGKILRWLYGTVMGRTCLKVLADRRLSVLCGKYLDSPFSTWLIPHFIQKNEIDMSEYQEEVYHCFNDCFSRRIIPDKRPVDVNPMHVIAPCDGLLSVYPIHRDTVIPAKQSRYTIQRLLRNQELAQKYEDGVCLVFRLCVNHYHRYAYIEGGKKGRNHFIPGKLHTVRPIALDTIPVYTENAREYTVIHTQNLGDVVQMEVGAMLVGKIQNYHGIKRVKRGEEKGRFLYGGSTIIVLLEKDKVKVENQFLIRTARGVETPVKLGQRIGDVMKVCPGKDIQKKQK